MSKKEIYPPAVPEHAEIDAGTFDYLDRDNPRSLYNIAPRQIKAAMARLPDDLLLKSETELVDELKPDRLLNLLRFRFWDEYNRAQDEVRGMNVDNLVKGVCSNAYFYKRILKSRLTVMWLITPPAEYIELAAEALNTGLHKIREIFNMPLYDRKGKPNTAVANVMLKAYNMLDMRVHGSPIQQHHIKSLQMTAKLSKSGSDDINQMIAEGNMDLLEKEMNKVRDVEEKKELLMEAQPKYEEFKTGAIDIEPEKVKLNPNAKEF